MFVKFLKFSFTVINLIHITQIDIQSNKYEIYLKFGDLSSNHSKIEISNITHPYDYSKMTNWIENLK